MSDKRVIAYSEYEKLVKEILALKKQAIPIKYIEWYQNAQLHHISDYSAWEVLHHLVRDYKQGVKTKNEN